MWKRTYSSAVIFVAVAAMVLVPLLAYLQWLWIGQMSEREFERAESTLRLAALHFSFDLSDELTEPARALALQEGSPEDRITEELAHRFDRWKATARHPSIISRIYRVSSSPHDDRPLIDLLVPERHQFVHTVLPPDSNDLLARFDDAGIWQRAELEPDRLVFVLRAMQGFGFPLRPIELRRRGSTTVEPDDLFGSHSHRIIVMFRKDVILDTVLPALARDYFAPNGDVGYDVSVIDRRDPQTVVWSNNPENAVKAPTTYDLAVPLGVIPRFLRPGVRGEISPEPGRGSLPPETIRPEPPHLPGPAVQPQIGFLEMRVHNRAGSLEAAVRLNRYRNLAISFGILVFLSGSVVILLFAAHRARSLALEEIEFVAGVSHELRTPLAVMHSVGENLAHGVVVGAKRTREYGTLVVREVGRLSAIVDNALEYAGIQSGRRTYEMQLIDPALVLQRALHECEGTIAQAEVQSDLTVPAGLPTISADPQALQLALKNIIVNAVKYGKDGKWLGVSIRASSDAGRGTVHFSISDHGIGIETTDLERIFDAFFRGRTAHATQIPGSGLGLSLASHIVRAHNGTIDVRSVVGKGSTFEVRLPIAQSPKQGHS